MNRGIDAVIRALKRYDNFLVTTHINMEGDAIGSQLAMADILKRLGKRYIILDNDPIPPAFRFLAGGEKVKTKLGRSDRFEAVLALDCPVIERTGKVAPYFKKARTIINIDHHISNSNFGDAVWVAPQMSSCGEMLYCIYKRLGLPIDKKTALRLYVAIATDTGYFMYENTSAETHRIVSQLVKAGVAPLWAANQLNEKKSVGDLRLLCRTLNTLKLHYGGRVATLYTSARMLKGMNLRAERTEGFVNYARSINTVKIAVFFLERPDAPDDIHVSFRSKGDVNVNRLAAMFNGGGHPNASGCLLKGTIAQAKRTVLEKIKQYLNDVGAVPRTARN